MKFNLYVIRDCVAEQNGPVFQAVNDAVAMRGYNEEMRKSPYPSDFELIRIASMDNETLKIEEDYSLVLDVKEELEK